MVASPTAGEVVLVPFPFSDLSQSKLRPAVVLTDAALGDWVLCQVTSNPYGDSMAIAVTDDCFESGSLRRESFARPGKLFTASFELMVSRVGRLNRERFACIVEAVVAMLRRGVLPG